MAAQQIKSNHVTDADGNPAGGDTKSLGLSIVWQRGPLKIGTGEVREANGCFLETLIAVALDRLAYYQTTKFKCDANAEAIAKLEEALAILANRTKAREERGVEGTHKV